MTHFTVGSTLPRVEHVAAAGVFAYAFPFPAIDPEDITVYVGDELADGGYTVTGLRQTAGGTVTFDHPVEAGATITILRARPARRMTDFADGGEFRADMVNDEFDSLTMMEQDVREALGRAVRIGPTVRGVDLRLPAPLPPRRAIISNVAATGLTFSTYDPDTTVALAQEAVADAHAALDKANAAIAMAAGAGVGSRKSFGPIVLVAGVQKYPLPGAVAKPADVDLYYGGAYQTDQWEITNEFGVGMTLTLFPQVVAENPTDEQWLAGMKIWGKLTSGLTSSAIGNEIIQERHIASGAIDIGGRLIAAGPSNMRLRTNSAGRVIYETSLAALEWTNVRDHGAVGNGIADDTAAIRAAIQAMANLGVLYFPPGRYGVSDAIELQKAGCVMGMPNASVIVPLTPDKDIFLVTQVRTHIEGLTFAAPPGFRVAGTAIKVTTGSLSKIKLCEFHRQFNSIWATGVFGATLTVDECFIYETTPGATCIRIDNGYDVAILDTLISNPIDARPSFGIYISGAGDVEILNVGVLCCDYGLAVYAPAGRTLASMWVMMSFFSNCGRGASLIADGGAIVRSVFTQNWFSSSHVDDGFFLSTANGGIIDGVSFSNCDFYGNARNGLMVYSPGISNIEIVGSRAAGNAQNGFILGWVTGASVSNWSITSSFAGAGFGWPGNGAYGVFAVAGAQHYTLGMNRLRGNGLGAAAGINFGSPTVFGNQT